MKTSIEMLNDSYERAEKQRFIINQIDDNTYSVFNEYSNNEYILEVDNDLQMVLNCTCMHYQYRCIEQGIVCKHIIALAHYLNYNF